ncbi:MAG: GDSL-type esterase/lipase family protein [Bacteroidales bacterium]|nr:GDSL-type esterase/lipase family protein [Bacteroidales bacterium]MDD4385004.1 GDSL-type esterase/lipase family protein [Bacteroidales bacterium]
MIKKIYTLLLLVLIGILGFGQPFINDINRFKEIDKQNPTQKNAILFIGSSSFTMWYDVQEQFPEHTIINRAFGGSTLEDQIRYFEDVVLPYNPKQIVIYCGENDFAASDTVTVKTVMQRFVKLYSLIATSFPGAKISYVSMKPSPSRWHLAEKLVTGNKNIKEFLESKPNTSYINIWDGMLNDSRLPNTSIFLDDMLHMNANGYKIWQTAILPHLVN